MTSQKSIPSSLLFLNVFDSDNLNSVRLFLIVSESEATAVELGESTHIDRVFWVRLEQFRAAGADIGLDSVRRLV